jgi:hypothetical protein
VIRVNVQQGSQAWLDARVGVLTASNFDKLITPKTQKPSASMDQYVYDVLAEIVMGRSLDDASSGYMERGTKMEREARAWYEFETDTEIEEVGFLLRDDRRVGCSPDGLVGDDGGLEIKCPSAGVHVSYLLGDAYEKYYCQVQGGLWITGRKWWDLVSYCPGFPPKLVRFAADAGFHAKLSDCVDQALKKLDEGREQLKALGLSMEPTITLTEALAQARAA